VVAVTMVGCDKAKDHGTHRIEEGHHQRVADDLQSLQKGRNKAD